MATREIRQNLPSAVAFVILPMFLLVKTSTTMLSGPTSAKAAIQPTLVISPSSAGRPRVLWTEQQRAAADHIEFLKNQSFDPSPLHHATVQISPDPSPNITATDLPAISVQMIMSSPTETVALIDGRRCVVGDTLGQTDWDIIDIDPDALTVTLKHARTHQLALISVQTPE